MKPIFEGAPGHIVRRAGNKWEVRWQARTDLVAKGFTPKSERIWIGDAPTDIERAHVADRCRRLQDEMLVYSRGVLHRSPEVFQWVLAVIGYKDRKASHPNGERDEP